MTETGESFPKIIRVAPAARPDWAECSVRRSQASGAPSTARSRKLKNRRSAASTPIVSAEGSGTCGPGRRTVGSWRRVQAEAASWAFAAGAG